MIMIYFLFGRRKNLLVPFISWVQLLFCSECSKIWTEVFTKSGQDSAHNIGKIRCSNVEGSFLTFMIRKKKKMNTEFCKDDIRILSKSANRLSTKEAWFDLAFTKQISDQKLHGHLLLYVRNFWRILMTSCLLMSANFWSEFRLEKHSALLINYLLIS